ncbi:MAG: hypothetical protein ABR969_09855 [Sedimentisphaerales bacterium]
MKLVIGLLIGIFVVFLLGAVNMGGTGTYQTQMSYDGKRIAVMDTRTGTVKIFNVQPGDEILSFTDNERVLKDYRIENK